eukprot:tig00020941_g16225.t1
MEGDAAGAIRRRLARLARAAAQERSEHGDLWRLEAAALTPLAALAVSASEAVAALRGPLCAGLRELSLRLLASDSAGLSRPRSGPPLHVFGLGAAVPASVRALTVACVASELQLRGALDSLDAACSELGLHALPARPSLHSLSVLCEGREEDPPSRTLPRWSAWGNAGRGGPARLLPRLPALRLAHTLRLHSAAAAAAAAAAAGLRCRCLLLGRQLDAAAARDAVRALWTPDPAAFPGHPWLAGLEFVGCGVPPDIAPADLAGADFIGVHLGAIGPAALDWITRVPTLSVLDLSRGPSRRRWGGCRPRRGWRCGRRRSPPGPSRALRLLRALAAAPRLLRGVDVDLSEYPALPDEVARERERLWLAQAAAAPWPHGSQGPAMATL